ncbi:MAG TPA: hypothetical protein VFK05_19720 [Polyangiaceae bacterium]|nr:hypothetical protein [Polyangiaceae bacterium]
MSDTDPKRSGSLENEPELSEAPQVARENVPDSSRLEAVRARIQAIAGTSVAPAAKSWPTALKVALPLLGVAGVVAGVVLLTRHAEAPLSSLAPTAFVKTMQLPPTGSPPNSTLPLPPPQWGARATIAGTPQAAPSTAVSPVSPLAASELDTLEQARRALQTDPARALLLTSGLERFDPGSPHAEEREAIAIEALARLGQLSAARSRAERFKAAYPGSAQLARVQRTSGLDAQGGAGN